MPMLQQPGMQTAVRVLFTIARDGDADVPGGSDSRCRPHAAHKGTAAQALLEVHTLQDLSQEL